MKIFISTSSFAKYDKGPLKALKKNRIKYTLNPYKRRLTRDEIFKILKKGQYNGLIAGTEPLSGDVLQEVSPLKVISRVGVGLDNVDLKRARALNIKVYNTPYVLIDSVSELTIGLILSGLRKITSMDKDMRKKRWNKEMGLLLCGKTLGLIGFGKIGRRVAGLAHLFGAKIHYYDIKTIKNTKYKQVSLKKLLKTSDIVSIHASSTKRFITKNAISNMKNGAILVNTSRGSVIDEEALYKALKSGKIAMACLDVFNSEPYSGKLAKLNNVVLTPHIGSYAREARVEMEKEAVGNLIKGFKKARIL